MIYAKYYLYAINHNKGLDEALHIRGVLFRAASSLEMTTREKLGELFAGNKIVYRPFNVKPVFDHYNALMNGDRIDLTPTCVIIRDGKKDRFTGAAAIAKALALI